MKILNIGSLNIDYVYEVDNFVKKGETKLSKKLNIYSGGKGLNQSIALKRAGAKVYHGGLIGMDGSFLKELLEKEEVNTDFIKVVNSPSGHAIIQIDESGDNCILLHGGANQLFTEEIIDSILENFNEGDYLLLQNEINLMEYIINKASEKGLTIVLNPSPINSKLKSYPLEKVNIFILNEVEGKELTYKEKEEEILNELIFKYPEAQFILTLGEKGVIYGANDERIEVKAKPVKAVDTTAAGDTFTGYYLASMLSGKSVQEALETATVASSITVTREGAANSIPYMKEIL